MSTRIAIVEDDVELARLIALWLQSYRYGLTLFASAELFIEHTRESNPFDLIILDWNLPGMSGLELLNHLVGQKLRIPIMFITARSGSEDLASALLTGADDYIVKPVKKTELTARVHALLRRAAGGSQTTSPIHWLHSDNMTLQVDQKRLPLTRNELLLLQVMLANPGTILSREELIDSIWGDERYQHTRALDILISRLRNKLTQSGIETLKIESCYGNGYRLKEEISSASTHSP